jgi:hypothetical protein
LGPAHPTSAASIMSEDTADAEMIWQNWAVIGHQLRRWRRANEWVRCPDKRSRSLTRTLS